MSQKLATANGSRTQLQMRVDELENEDVSWKVKYNIVPYFVYYVIHVPVVVMISRYYYSAYHSLSMYSKLKNYMKERQFYSQLKPILSTCSYNFGFLISSSFSSSSSSSLFCLLLLLLVLLPFS